MFTSDLLKGREAVLSVKNSLNTYNTYPPNAYEEAVWCQIKQFSPLGCIFTGA